MFDFLKFPKYKVEELNNGQFIAYVKKKAFGLWLGIDKTTPGAQDWFIPSGIVAFCLCDDEEEAVTLISAHTKYVSTQKKLSIEEQIMAHQK